MPHHERLIHDVAVAAATGLMERIGPVFLPAEARDAWQLCYEHIRAALESYLVMRSRMNQRLCKPSEN